MFTEELQIPKEEWDNDQITELEEGISQGLDVAVYARKEFMAMQMRQIRMGLSEGLDVKIYAIPEYDWFQMEEIRKGMAAGVNYQLYARPSLDYRKMRQIRKGLQVGIDLSPFVKLDAGILRELRKGIQAKVNLVEYIKKGYEVEQLEQIRHALQKKLDIDPYLIYEFRGASIREISKGLEKGINPAIYAKIDYGWQQMREIRLGLENRVDVNVYANNLFSWQQMREIRLGLEEGLDVAPYRSFMYTAKDMERIRKKLSCEQVDRILKTADIQKVQKVAVFVSMDEMEACIEIKCGDGESIEKWEILHALNAEGVTEGILEDEIEKAIEGKRYHETIVAAKGRKARRGADGWYELFFDTNVDRTPRILEDGSVDYQNIRWYEIVEEGQKIAYYHDAEYGTDGCTVTGKVIKAKKGHEKSILTGKGFVRLEDGRTYQAAVSGKIEQLQEHRIEITRLCVLEEVTLATGNIDFDGCIYIRGNVGSGVTISATEDVIINGSAEAAVIKCRGEILLRQGINGGGNGYIEAGKKVTGKFLEAVKVVSGGDICANYCLNCDMFAEGSILVHGAKGLLAGGTAQAVREIRASNVGNRAKISTTLRLGVYDAILNELKQVEKQLAEKDKESLILQNAYYDFQRKYPPEVRNTMEMFLKIENAIYTVELQKKTISGKKEELERNIAAMAGGKAVISGTLYEGTTIIIDSVRWRATSVKDVTVRRTKDKIMAYSN